MRTMRKKETRVKCLAAVAVLAASSAGCQLIVDFNRGLIDAGTVDGSFSDTGAPGVDAGKDALPVPDAVGDVVYVDGRVAAHDATMDANGDANGDAKADGTPDARANVDAMDAAADTGTHDARADTADKDAHADVAPKADGAHDAADAG
jgi:hypothetical protein